MLPEGTKVETLTREEFNSKLHELPAGIKQKALEAWGKKDFEGIDVPALTLRSDHTINQVIRLVSGHKDFEKNAVHEAWHAIHNLLPIDMQKQLSKGYDLRFGEKNHNERMANDFSDYVTGKTSRIHPVIRGIYSKIKDFLVAVKEVIKNMGYKSYSDIVDQLKTLDKFKKETFDLAMSGELRKTLTANKGTLNLDKLNFSIDKKTSQDIKDSVDGFISRFSKDKTLHKNVDDAHWFTRLLANPYHYAERYPSFKKIFDEANNMVKRKQETITYFMDKYKRTIYDPEYKMSDKLKNVILEGDKLSKEYNREELDQFKLSPKEQQVYQDIQKYHEEIWTKVVHSIEDAKMSIYQDEKWFKDLDTLTDNKTTPEIKSAIYKKYDEGTIASIKEAEKTINATQNKLAELRASYGKLKGYFPRERSGDFVVRAFIKTEKGQGAFSKDENGKFIKDSKGDWNVTHREQFEDTATERRKGKIAELAQIRKYGKDSVEATYDPKPSDDIYQITTDKLQRFMNVVAEKMGEDAQIGDRKIVKEHIASMIDDFITDTVDLLKSRGAGKSSIGRTDSYITGFKTDDMLGIIRRYGQSNIGLANKVQTAYVMNHRLNEINSKAQPELYKAAKEYTHNFLRNETTTDRIIGKYKAFLAVYYLGGRFSSMVTNATQTMVMTYPHLYEEMKGVKRGNGVYGNAGKTLLVAVKDLTAERLSEKERQMLATIHGSGEDMATYISEVSGSLEGGTHLNSFVDIMMKPFQLVETTNRRIAALAGYRVAIQKGLTHEQAVKSAEDFMTKTQFAYGKQNRWLPAGGSGGGSALLNVAYSFQSYGHNYLLSLVRTLQKGADGKRQLGVLGRSLSMIAVLGGATALPFVDDTLDFLTKITGIPFKSDMKKLLSKVDPIFGEIGLEGLPTILGISLAGSLKIGSPLKVLYDKNVTLEDSALGVTSSVINKGGKAIDSLLAGNYLKALAMASPSAVTSAYQAYVDSEYGAETYKGKPIFDAKGKQIHLSGFKSIAQGLGLRPTELTSARMTETDYRNITEHFADKKSDITSKFNHIRETKDFTDMPEVRKMIQEYNIETRKYQGIQPIVMSKLLSSYNRSKRPNKNKIKVTRGLD
jgi:hypothetical protein